ncbi:MAG: hypothetical protein HRU21_11250 [Pseudomonadales bacterium]|nr:hypothetical protein [Pseudomonadales bacterium]
MEASVAVAVGEFVILDSERVFRSRREGKPDSVYIDVVFYPREFLRNEIELDFGELNFSVKRYAPEGANLLDICPEGFDSASMLEQVDIDTSSLKAHDDVQRERSLQILQDPCLRNPLVTNVVVFDRYPDVVRDTLVPIVGGKEYVLFLFTNPNDSERLLTVASFNVYEAAHYQELLKLSAEEGD